MANETASIDGKVTIDTTSVTKAQKKLDSVVGSLEKIEKESDQKINFDASGVDKLNTKLGATSKAANDASSKMLKFGRQARTATQNASYQVQDIAVQLAAGTNKLTIISQQIPQLLGGFGVYGAIAGAVIGIGAAIARSLVPQLLDAKSATEELEAAQERLGDVFETNEEGVITYTDKFQSLIDKHYDLANAKVAAELKRTETALSRVGEAASDVLTEFESMESNFGAANFDSLKDYVKEFGSISGAIQNVYSNSAPISQDIGLNYAARAAKDLKDELGLTTDQVLELGSSLSNVAKGNASTAQIQELADKLEVLRNELGGNASQAFLDFNEAIQKVIANSKDLFEVQEELNKPLEDNVVTLTKAQEKYERLAEKLKDQADLIGKSKVESLQYAKNKALETAETDKATDSAIKSITASYDTLIAYAKEEEQLKRLADLKRDQAAASREQAKANREASSFNYTDDPYEQAEDSRDKDLATLGTYLTLSEEQIAQKRINIIDKYNQTVADLDRQALKDRLQDQATFGDEFEQLQANYALTLLNLHESDLDIEMMDEAMDRLAEEYQRGMEELQQKIDESQVTLFGAVYDYDKITEGINSMGSAFASAESSLSSLGSDSGALIAQKAQDALKIAEIGIAIAQGQVLGDPEVPWYVKAVTAASLGIQLASLFGSLTGFSGSSSSSSSSSSGGDDYSYSNEAPSDANTSGITGKEQNGQPIYINMNTSVDPITGESLATVMTNDRNVVNSQVTNMNKNKTTFGMAING